MCVCVRGLNAIEKGQFRLNRYYLTIYELMYTDFHRTFNQISIVNFDIVCRKAIRMIAWLHYYLEIFYCCLGPLGKHVFSVFILCKREGERERGYSGDGGMKQCFFSSVFLFVHPYTNCECIHKWSFAVETLKRRIYFGFSKILLFSLPRNAVV